MNRFCLFLGCAALVAGCFGPSPKLNYYTLSAAQASPPAAGAASRPLNVYVGPVTIPETVDRPQMVTRVDANQVEIAELERWAEPLKSAIPRVVADTLGRELGPGTVMTSKQSATLTFDYRVALDVQRFDFSASDGATIDALWTIRTEGEAAPRVGRSQAREPAGAANPEAMAAAQGRALEKVAREIAAAIREMGRQ
jgi:uncharacterized protein